MKVPINPFVAQGLVPMPLGTTDGYEAKLSLQPRRMWELRERVRRGALYMNWWSSPSSAWIGEALREDFTMAYLGYRSLVHGEKSVFASVFQRLDSETRTYHSSGKHLTKPVAWGFDLEPCQNQQFHFRFITELWRSEAADFRELVTRCRGN